MKKLLLLVVVSIFTTSCSILGSSGDVASVYTTVYPITFLTDTLLGDYAEIHSIYPSDSNILEYEFTSKQLQEYSEADLFVYNGLSNEKNIARDIIEESNNILLIDSAYSLVYENSIEELWLNPNNYLMLAYNIKTNLIEYVESRELSISKDAIVYIEDEYEKLNETLSVMNADLRKIGKTASELNKDTIVIESSAYNFLEDYGFNVIALDDENMNLSTDSILNSFENETYAALIYTEGSTNEVINALITEDIPNISFNSMNSSEEINYIEMMQSFISSMQTFIK